MLDRRGFITHFFPAMGILHSVKAQAPISTNRTFTLWSPAPTVTAQTIRIQTDGIYYLTVDKSSRKYAAGAKSYSGDPLFDFTLAGRQYYFMDIRPSGGLLLQRVGGPLEEFNRKGEKVAEWPTGESPVRQKMVGDALVRLLPSSEFEVIPLSSSPRRRFPAQQLKAPPRDFSLESTSPNDVQLVDRESGGITRIDLSRDQVQHFPATATEFRDSAEYYAKRTKSSNETHPLTILATGVDGRGNVLTFIAPYTIQRSVILRLSPSGAVAERIYLTLPERTLSSFKIPWKVGQVGGQLCLAFLQGGVAVYSGIS